MCGINGIYAYNVAAGSPDRGELLATRDHMIKRGPDGCGEWWSDDRRLGLGHRRLAIVDLTEGGAQPMMSDDGRYIVTFNGEIYNYPELRRELEATGVRFRSSSDTEVLLVLYAREGETMLPKLRGMFAFAIWDTMSRTLFVARDPYGIKPLYISHDGWSFRFASQVKALLAGGRISREPEPAGIVGFHIWGSVPEPFTLYRDIRSLAPGHSMLIDELGPRKHKPYASVTTCFARGAAAPAPTRELHARTRAAVLDSVRVHLMADVDVGLFLSAGVDSGTLLGLMRDAGHSCVRTITLGFDEFRGTSEDESGLAAQVASLYGAEHVVRRVRQAEFDDELPLILDAMDQPSVDGINTWFTAKAAREAGLKVALSGLGGDELFAGYNSFRDVPRWVALCKLPSLVPGLGVAFRLAATGFGFGKTLPKLPGLIEHGGSYEGAYLLRRGLYLPSELGEFLDADLVKQGLKRLRAIERQRTSAQVLPTSGLSRVAALESSRYMLNQLLRDADWAGMAHSVEIRTPLVDYTLLQSLAPSVPHLHQPGIGKKALASSPSVDLPNEILSRSKTGFGVPTGKWLDRPTPATLAAKGSASRVWGRQVYAASSTNTRPARLAVPVNEEFAA